MCCLVMIYEAEEFGEIFYTYFAFGVLAVYTVTMFIMDKFDLWSDK